MTNCMTKQDTKNEIEQGKSAVSIDLSIADPRKSYFSEINMRATRVVIRGRSYSSQRKVRWSALLTEFNLIEINGSR